MQVEGSGTAEKVNCCPLLIVTPGPGVMVSEVTLPEKPIVPSMSTTPVTFHWFPVREDASIPEFPLTIDGDPEKLPLNV